MAFGVFSTTPFMDLKTSEQNTVVEFLKKVNGLESSPIGQKLWI